MTYLAGLSFPGQQRAPAIHCDGAGCGAVIRIDGLPPSWFLAGKPKRGWALILEPGEKRIDYCPRCKPVPPEKAGGEKP